MIMKLSKFMTKEKLNAFVNGMFYSKLSYCLQVFGNVFELEKYKETSSRYTSYTRRDNHHLQVLQNKMNRFLVNAKKDTPTTELLRRTDTLSVQQLIAYQTAMSVYKILRTGKPSYLAKKLTMTTRNLRGNQGNINQGRKSLSISKEGFLYRGALLFNSLEADVRREPKLERFKELLKKWIKDKIPAKPASKIPYLPTRQHHVQAPPQQPDGHAQQPEPPDQGQNNIKNYFQPLNLTLPQHRDSLDQHGPPPSQLQDPTDYQHGAGPWHEDRLDQHAPPPPQIQDTTENQQHQENNNQRSIRNYFHPT